MELGDLEQTGVLAVVPGDDAGGRSRPVTLDDVARMSGVSRATASRALNGHARVSADVRARVQMIADQLGYRPNTAARSLASGRAGVLGLVLPGGHLISAPYEAHLLEAVADAATASGPRPDAVDGGDRAEPVAARRLPQRASSTASSCRAWRSGAPWVEDLFDGPHPCVLVGRHATRADIPHIEVTNEASAAAAVDHLIAGGAAGSPSSSVPPIASTAATARSATSGRCTATGSKSTHGSSSAATSRSSPATRRCAGCSPTAPTRCSPATT